MIRISDNHECCGCAACSQACPQECIEMIEDEEGFLYPHVKIDDCIECGQCESVCPIIQKKNKIDPQKCYAAKNKNDKERIESSSGGVFSLFAEKIVKDGGVVFGAKFNKTWEVEHGYTKREDELKDFRTSKYVQSKAGNAYKEAKRFLDEGLKVLYSGTSCQISGLINYLGKDYDNLLTIDVLCHGVPSPKVWRKYLQEIKGNARQGENSVSSSLIPQGPENDALRLPDDSAVESINFRDKRTGWKKFSFALALAKATADGKKNSVSLSYMHRENSYMMAFICNLILRPSCYKCPSKGGRSGADITLADFWNIRAYAPEMDDNKGVSMVIVNSERGEKLFQQIVPLIEYRELTGKAKLPRNYYKSPRQHPNRKRFFIELSSSEKMISDLLDNYWRPTFSMKVRRGGDIMVSYLKAICRKFVKKVN